jgi:hypothetical protein
MRSVDADSKHRLLFRSRFVIGLAVWLCFPLKMAVAQGTPSQPRPSSTSAPSHTKSAATLLIQSDMDCIFTVDDQPSQAMRSGETKRVTAALGEHLVTAVSGDGKDRWKTVVDFDKPVQKVVLIELLKVRAARESGERETEQLEQEIKAKTAQAKAVRGATETLKQQRAETEDQIVELQKQVRQEESAAQDDEVRAQQLRQQGAAAATQGTNLGNMTGLIGNMEADNAISSARAHRAKAGQLQDQITDLNRQLERLNRGESVSGPTSHTDAPSSGQTLSSGLDLVNTAWEGFRWRTDRSGKAKGNPDSHFIKLLQGSLCDMPQPKRGHTCSWRKINDSVSIERRYLGTTWTETFTLSLQGSELVGRSTVWDTSNASWRQDNFSYRLKYLGAAR